jgi:F-type H+-transporting ATPase subunit a
MEQIEHPLLVVDAVNGLIAALFGLTYEHAHPFIPNYLVMAGLIAIGFTVLGLILRARLRVENPGTLQIILEDLVSAVVGLLEGWLGPTGRDYLPLLGTLGAFILAGNYIGLVPGFMSPTGNLNVTVGCAITTWVYYHLNGLRTHGVLNYLKHFAGGPGVPSWIAPVMFVVEIISHLSRVLSLSLRLFGNIFGEELVIAIFGIMIPYFFPLPMMGLALITGGLQAFIFVLLSVIYLQGATVAEHADDHAHETGDESPDALAVAAVA